MIIGFINLSGVLSELWWLRLSRDKLSNGRCLVTQMGARAMERCYNGPHVEWHPITMCVWRVELGSNDGLLVISRSQKKSRWEEASSLVSPQCYYANCEIHTIIERSGRGFPDKMERHGAVPASPYHRPTNTPAPEVRQSCHLFKCESARKSYLKGHLMATSSLGWAKRSSPQTVPLRCWPAFEMQRPVRCGSMAGDIIDVFGPHSTESRRKPASA